MEYQSTESISKRVMKCENRIESRTFFAWQHFRRDDDDFPSWLRVEIGPQLAVLIFKHPSDPIFFSQVKIGVMVFDARGQVDRFQSDESGVISFLIDDATTQGGVSQDHLRNSSFDDRPKKLDISSICFVFDGVCDASVISKVVSDS